MSIDKNHENLKEFLITTPKRVKDTVFEVIDIYKQIKWKKIKFDIMMKPEPSHRPRLCGYRVYVPGAAKNQRWFQNKVLPTLKGVFINTPCRFDVDIYCETPKSFTKTQKILAEMKILRPWGNIGDVDNFAKAVYDMCTRQEKRGSDGIISNDCLVIDSMLSKYYSMTPRYEISISFMDKIPNEILHILRLDCVDDETI